MKIRRTPLETASRQGLGVRRAFRYFAPQLGGAVFPSDRTGQAVSVINLELRSWGPSGGAGVYD